MGTSVCECPYIELIPPTSFGRESEIKDGGTKVNLILSFKSIVDEKGSCGFA